MSAELRPTAPGVRHRHYSIEDFVAAFGYGVETVRSWARRGIVPTPATHYVRPGGHKLFLAVPEAGPEPTGRRAPTNADKAAGLLAKGRKDIAP